MHAPLKALYGAPGSHYRRWGQSGADIMKVVIEDTKSFEHRLYNALRIPISNHLGACLLNAGITTFHLSDYGAPVSRQRQFEIRHICDTLMITSAKHCSVQLPSEIFSARTCLHGRVSRRLCASHEHEFLLSEFVRCTTYWR